MTLTGSHAIANYNRHSFCNTFSKNIFKYWLETLPEGNLDDFIYAPETQRS